MSGSLNQAITIVPTIDATGPHIPLFEDVLTYFKNVFYTVYGADTYLENDSQDGQLVGIFAKAYYDVCAVFEAVYASFSPTTAQGTGLSSVVKINGISRAVASNSQVNVLLGGTPGTTITNGYVTDPNNYRWNFPASVDISSTTFVLVDAVCSTPGAIPLAAGAILTLGNPTRGWNSATVPSNAVPGAPVETDALLRSRQKISVTQPSQSIMDGIRELVAGVPGVVFSRGYENDTDAVDANGQPPHSISFVVDGGDPGAIATAINLKKTAGSPTNGTTHILIADAYGNAKQINYYVAVQVPITINITIQAMPGYTTQTGIDLQTAVLTYGQSKVGIGQSILLSRFYVPAALSNSDEASTYNIKSIKIGRDAVMPAASDVGIAFNELPTFSAAAITLTVIAADGSSTIAPTA